MTSDEAYTLYEKPEGAISMSRRHGRQQISLFRKSDDEVIYIKIVSRPPGKDRDYYQLIAIDDHIARHVGSLLWKMASYGNSKDSR